MIWTIIIGLIVFLLLTLFVPGFRRALSTAKRVITILIIVLFLVSILIWAKSEDADFSSTRATFVSMFSYFSWVKSTGMATFDLGKNKTNEVINLFSKNKTK